MGGSPFFVLFDVDIPSLLDLSHAGCWMDDVQHLDAFLGDAVDDKVWIQDDVPVHAAFRG